jgi:hypothetical protein
VRELGFPALNLVSRSCGVPVSELGAFYNRAQPIPENYLPILYLHFFGNVSPDRAKQYGIEHEL